MFKYLYMILVFSSIILSQQKIYFDVKTPLNEKINLAAVKNGAIYFLSNSDKYGVKEINEDYSLWLKNYESEKAGDTVKITVDVEIRTPSFLRNGKLVKRDRITEYIYVNETIKENQKIDFENFKKKVKDVNQSFFEEGYIMGKSVYNIVNLLIGRIKHNNK